MNKQVNILFYNPIKKQWIIVYTTTIPITQLNDTLSWWVKWINNTSTPLSYQIQQIDIKSA